jgi:hypothetical protein
MQSVDMKGPVLFVYEALSNIFSLQPVAVVLHAFCAGLSLISFFWMFRVYYDTRGKLGISMKLGLEDVEVRKLSILSAASSRVSSQTFVQTTLPWAMGSVGISVVVALMIQLAKSIDAVELSNKALDKTVNIVRVLASLLWAPMLVALCVLIAVPLISIDKSFAMHLPSGSVDMYHRM